MNRDRAVFFDRDGTINEEANYLDRMDKLVILPGAAEAFRRVNAMGLRAIVVTNQSGVARGLLDEAFVQTVHTRIREILAASGAVVDRFYHCPHHPSEGSAPYRRACTCRKPAPGMPRQAAADFHLNLAKSYVVGDTAGDLEMAERIGARGILVRTGLGSRQDLAGRTPAFVADDILAAVRWIERDLRP